MFNSGDDDLSVKIEDSGDYLDTNVSGKINTCKDAIQCRPWAHPPPSLFVYFLRTDFKYVYLFGILRTNDYIWSAVVFF